MSVSASTPASPPPAARDASERAVRLAARHLGAWALLWAPCPIEEQTGAVDSSLRVFVARSTSHPHTEEAPIQLDVADLSAVERAMRSQVYEPRRGREPSPLIFDRVIEWATPTSQPAEPIQEELWSHTRALQRISVALAAATPSPTTGPEQPCNLAVAGAWQHGQLNGLLFVLRHGTERLRPLQLRDLLDHASILGAIEVQHSGTTPSAPFHASETLYRSVAATMNDGLLVVSKDGGIAAANPAASVILGAGQRELIGHDALRHFICLDERLQALPPERSPIQLVMCARQSRVQRQSAIKRLDGQLRWVDLNCQPLSLDEYGLPDSILLTFRDITRQREVEQSLAVTQARAEMALQSSGQGVWDWHADGTIFLSKTWKEMLGYQDHEIAGHSRDWYEHVHPDDLELVRERMREHLRGHTEVFEAEYRMRHRKGHTIVVMDRGRVVSRDRDGRAERMAGTVMEVTQQRQAEQERRDQHAAELASRAKTEFLSRMSHEMRTPLNAVIGFSQVLLDPLSHLRPDQVRERARHILRAGEHLLSLVNDVLDLQQVEQGQLRMNVHAIHLPALLQQVVEMLSPAAQEQGVWLREPSSTTQALGQVTADEAWVAADERYLLQVLLNLVSNAIKYNRPGGSVELRMETRDDQRVLHIRDTGWGMDGEQLLRLFQPFERLGKETSGIQGTGLGLLISRQLIHAMGGSLDVTSQPGTGTTMHLQLPGAQPQDPISDIPPSGLTPTSAAAKRLLARMNPDHAAETSGTDELSSDRLAMGASRAPAVTEQTPEESASPAHPYTDQTPQSPRSPDSSTLNSLPVSPSRAGLRVLYVEDNPINTLLFEHTVGAHQGIELRCAAHGPEALELVSDWEPEVLVLDSHLPGMDGFELLERLRQIPSLQQAPAFMCSADAMPDDVTRARQAGFSGYWAKPINIAQILQDLSPWLSAAPAANFDQPQAHSGSSIAA
jgi:PAS domain S-box-containing protein